MAGRTVCDRPMRTRMPRAVRAAAAVARASLALAACGSTKDAASSGGGGGEGRVGVSLPLLTSPFWQSYNDYVPEIPAKWESDTAASKLDTVLTSDPDITGIYLQAGGVYLAPTLQTLKSKGMLKKAGQRRPSASRASS